MENPEILTQPDSVSRKMIRLVLAGFMSVVDKWYSLIEYRLERCSDLYTQQPQSLCSEIAEDDKKLTIAV